MLGDGGAEGVDHDGTADAVVGGDRQGVAGVVVQSRQDLDLGAGGQAVVREVGLPALVGLLGGEADIRGPGTLAGRRSDKPAPAQGAVDRGPRHPQSVMVLEMPGNGVATGIQPLAAEAPAQLDDQLDRRVSNRARRRLGATRPRLEGGVALGAPTRHELVHPRSRHAVGGGDLSRSAAFHDHGGYDQASFRHPPTSDRATRRAVDAVRYVSRHVSGMS